MAANTYSYSGKQFQVYMATDKVASDGVGTFFTGSNFSGGIEMDVEGITVPTWNPVQEFEMRSGQSRVAQFSDIFSSTKRVVTEFSLSGRLTVDIWQALLENVTASSVDADKILALAGNYNPANFGHGSEIASNTSFEKTLSFYFQVPTQDDVTDYSQSFKLAGCVCTNFSVDADLDSAAGRFNYSATFQTAYAPAMGAQSVSSASAVGDNIYLSDLGYNFMSIMEKVAAGNDTADMEPIWKTYSLGVESPAAYLGMSTTGTPSVISRAVPELTITVGGSIKYDKLSHTLVEAHLDKGEDSYITQYLSDVDKDAGTYAVATGKVFNQSSAAKFGVHFRQAKLMSAEISSDDVAMVNFEGKVLQPSSGITIALNTGTYSD